MELENKSMLFFLKLSVVLYVCIALVNTFTSMDKSRLLGFSIFGLIASGIWSLGLLSSLGIIKHVETTEDGKTIYKTSIPIGKIGVLRIAEVFYYVMFHKSTFNLTVFLVTLALDVLYVLILLFDKSRYYYESIDIENEEEN